MYPLIRLCAVAVTACLASCSLWAQQAAGTEELVFVKAGHLLNPVDGKVLSNAVITVRGERVTAIGDDGTDIPAGATVVDLSDSYVLPGLIDMHTHIAGHLDTYYFAEYFQSPHRGVIGGVVNAERTLVAGFTSIRSVGAPDFQDIAIRDAINAGEIPGRALPLPAPASASPGGTATTIRSTMNSRNAPMEWLTAPGKCAPQCARTSSMVPT